MQEGWEDGDPHRMRGSQRDRSRKNQVMPPTPREEKDRGGVSAMFRQLRVQEETG